MPLKTPSGNPIPPNAVAKGAALIYVDPLTDEERDVKVIGIDDSGPGRTIHFQSL